MDDENEIIPEMKAILEQLGIKVDKNTKKFVDEFVREHGGYQALYEEIVQTPDVPIKPPSRPPVTQNLRKKNPSTI